ncbi:MAG: 6-pyruvoyl-tetrahydropterin synthase-related protein [Candidatus Gottesmanbacteria bacterium]
MRNKLFDFFGLIIALFVLTITTRPLFHPGLFPTADNISVVRIEEMKNEINSGQFPVRYVKNLGKGHGYMLFNYYAPLPFYVGALFNNIGTNLVGSLKRTYLIAFVIGTVSTYFLVKRLYGRWSGIIASWFFSLNPFLGVDTYSRGGLGEVWAISLIPTVIYFLISYLSYPKIIYLIFSSISIAALILSHNLTSYLGMVFILAFIFLTQRTRRIFALLLPILLGLGLASFFWLPSFIEKNYVWVWYMEKNISQYNENFLPLSILYSPDSIFRINYLNPLYGLAFIWVGVIIYWFKKKIDRTFIVSFSFALITLLMTISISKPVWDNFSGILSIVQFPWRFLTINMIFISLVIGFLVSGNKKVNYIIGTIILFLAVINSFNSFRPKTYEFVDKYRAEDPCGTSWGYEYLPIWTKVCLKLYPDVKFDFFEGGGEIKSIVDKSGYYKFTVATNQDSILRINEYYYPGWHAYINGQATTINYHNLYGIISFPLKKGNSIIELKLFETPLADLANKISLISLFLLILLFFWQVCLWLKFKPPTGNIIKNS